MAEEKVAGYIAKYATKGATVEAAVDRRITSLDDLQGKALSAHQHRLIETCWQLAAVPQLSGLRLREAAHMLGFAGHFSTKSRGYSTTLGALRQARRDYRAEQARAHGRDQLTGDPDQDGAELVGSWQFAGQGHLHPVDAFIAQLTRDEREQRRRARWTAKAPPIAYEGRAA